MAMSVLRSLPLWTRAGCLRNFEEDCESETSRKVWLSLQ